MCKHVFVYPEDKRENYNPDRTLTGVCRYCRATEKSYGMRWMIPRHDDFFRAMPIRCNKS